MHIQPLVLVVAPLVLLACSASPATHDAANTSDQTLSFGSFDPIAAIAYADANWNNGQGECAEFTTRSLGAGHLAIDVISYVPTLFQALASVEYEEHSQGATRVSAAAGDVVIYSDAMGDGFCDPAAASDEYNCGHACIVAVPGTSEDTIAVDCHNNAHYHLALGAILGSGYSTYRLYHLDEKDKGSPSGTEACQIDADCNSGRAGTGIVCASSENYCIKGCHSNRDCEDGQSCVETNPHWSCQ